ncbi:MAG: LacI family DNA-binding transcriptional regulator [Opitutaceae bacterium]|nr:LacI family DNA-binding transcriptional regulator [Opitutaceae bacterium]
MRALEIHHHPIPAQDMERITLTHIADKAKVSRMTVSLALRDDPSLPESTRRRIRTMADKMGYRPDPDITRLMEVIRSKKNRKQPSKIAYLTAYQNRSDWEREPTQRLYFEGARQRASELGYILEEHWLRAPGMTDRRLSEVIRNRGIESVVVAPLPGHEPIFDQFRWNYVSAVELGYSLPRPALNRACNHQFQSMMLLIRTLHTSGYRRIGLAMPRDQDERVNHHWRAAYLGGQSLWIAPNEWIVPFLPSNWTKAEFQRWFTANQPDCLITIGKDLLDWLATLGLRAPRNVGLANVDLRPEMKGTTGIDQNSHKVGAAAIDLLVSQLRRNEKGIPSVPRIVMVEGSFVQGKTTRCQKSPGS